MSATKLNRMVDVLNAVQNVSGDGVITTSATDGGLNIGLSLNALIPKLPGNPIHFGLAQQFDGE
ncbi:MAG: hypothetical protein QGD93_10095, partial [Actinomycetota bacterium]|nr:hypothetical protein [Actinomycetota bacterium]